MTYISIGMAATESRQGRTRKKMCQFDKHCDIIALIEENDGGMLMEYALLASLGSVVLIITVLAFVQK